MKINSGYTALNIMSILLYIIIPIAFVFNPLVSFLFVLLQLFFQLAENGYLGNSMLVMLFNAFLYSGMTFLGLRLYDWVILIYFLQLLLLKHGNIKIELRVIIFGIGVLLVYIVHGMMPTDFLETMRYLISLCLVVNIINLRPNVDSISRILTRICTVNLYNAITLYVLISMGYIRNYASSIIATNIYLYTDEIRLNGFFSDPNKFMTFSLALLFIFEVFVNNRTLRLYGIAVSCVATIISMSRTGLLCIVLYFILKWIQYIQRKSKKLFYLTIVGVIIFAIVFFILPDITNTFVNTIYTITAEILGRQHTLSINASLQDDNRIRIWGIAMKYINDSPIFGSGWLAYERLLPYPTHNTFISLLLDGGVFVLLVYFFMFWPLFTYKQYHVTIPCILIPAIMLDLGNYRLWFMLLALTTLKVTKEVHYGKR